MMLCAKLQHIGGNLRELRPVCEILLMVVSTAMIPPIDSFHFESCQYFLQIEYFRLVAILRYTDSDITWNFTKWDSLSPDYF
jgi:hypothetical protein